MAMAAMAARAPILRLPGLLKGRLPRLPRSVLLLALLLRCPQSSLAARPAQQAAAEARLGTEPQEADRELAGSASRASSRSFAASPEEELLSLRDHGCAEAGSGQRKKDSPCIQRERSLSDTEERCV